MNIEAVGRTEVNKVNMEVKGRITVRDPMGVKGRTRGRTMDKQHPEDKDHMRVTDLSKELLIASPTTEYGNHRMLICTQNPIEIS